MSDVPPERDLLDAELSEEHVELSLRQQYYAKIEELKRADGQLVTLIRGIKRQREELDSLLKEQFVLQEVQRTVDKIEEHEQQIELGKEEIKKITGTTDLQVAKTLKRDVWLKLPDQVKLVQEKMKRVEEIEILKKQADLAEIEKMKIEADLEAFKMEFEKKVLSYEKCILEKNNQKNLALSKKQNAERCLEECSSVLEQKFDADSGKIASISRELVLETEKRSEVIQSLIDNGIASNTLTTKRRMKNYLEERSNSMDLIHSANLALTDLLKQRTDLEDAQSRRFLDLKNQDERISMTQAQRLIPLEGQSYDNISTPRPENAQYADVADIEAGSEAGNEVTGLVEATATPATLAAPNATLSAAPTSASSTTLTTTHVTLANSIHGAFSASPHAPLLINSVASTTQDAAPTATNTPCAAIPHVAPAANLKSPQVAKSTVSSKPSAPPLTPLKGQSNQENPNIVEVKNGVAPIANTPSAGSSASTNIIFIPPKVPTYPKKSKSRLDQNGSSLPTTPETPESLREETRAAESLREDTRAAMILQNSLTTTQEVVMMDTLNFSFSESQITAPEQQETNCQQIIDQTSLNTPKPLIYTEDDLLMQVFGDSQDENVPKQGSEEALQNHYLTEFAQNPSNTIIAPDSQPAPIPISQPQP